MRTRLVVCISMSFCEEWSSKQAPVSHETDRTGTLFLENIRLKAASNIGN